MPSHRHDGLFLDASFHLNGFSVTALSFRIAERL